MLLVFPLDGDHLDEALTNLRRAHELNPNDVIAINQLGLAEVLVGNPARGVAYQLQALRISPHDPRQYLVYNALASGMFFQGDYSKAIEYGTLGLSDARSFPPILLHLAASYIGVGDFHRASAALEAARQAAPDFVQRRLSGDVPYRIGEHRRRFTTFLRIAAGIDDLQAADGFR